MKSLGYILFFLRLIQTIGYIGLFHFSLLKIKEPKRERIAIITVIYFLTAVAFNAVVIFQGQRLAEIIYTPIEIALCLILIFIGSADKWSVSLFAMFTQFNLLLGISYISDFMATDSYRLSYQIKYLILRTLLLGGVLIFSFKFVRPRFRSLVEALGTEWRIISAAAFSFYLLEVIIQCVPDMYWYETNYRWPLVGGSYLVFFSIYWLMFRTIMAIIEKYKGIDREHILAQQNKMWEEQIEEQQLAVNSARRDRHDLRHHYDTLLTMLEDGKTIEVVSYLHEQNQRVESVPLTGICEHLAANAILSRWEARAKEKGIHTEIEARIPADLPMDSVALVGILANAFENAMEGCLRGPNGRERYIKVNISHSVYNGVGKLHIVFENSCEENIVFENDLPKSQKAGGGTGTKSILYTAEKHKGMVEFSTENGIFKTRVLLHL